MSAPAPSLDSELESFRKQWLCDLRTRRGSSSSRRVLAAHADSPPPAASSPPAPTRKQPAPPFSPSSGSRRPESHVEDDYPPPRVLDEPPASSGYTLDGSLPPPPEPKLISALDHYEEAMEKEAQGNMGDSLKLYRQAYRVRLHPPLKTQSRWLTNGPRVPARPWRR